MQLRRFALLRETLCRAVGFMYQNKHSQGMEIVFKAAFACTLVTTGTSRKGDELVCPGGNTESSAVRTGMPEVLSGLIEN